MIQEKLTELIESVPVEILNAHNEKKLEALMKVHAKLTEALKLLRA